MGEASGATVTSTKGRGAIAGAAGAHALSAIMGIRLKVSAMRRFVFIKVYGNAVRLAVKVGGGVSVGGTVFVGGTIVFVGVYVAVKGRDVAVSGSVGFMVP